MTEIRALLFDLDGTLVDTREPNYLAYREAFATAGFDLGRPMFDSTWGQDSRDFIPALMPGVSEEETERIRRVKRDSYSRHLSRAVPNSALIGFLRAMAPSVRTSLVTTAKSENAMAVLAAFGIADCFDEFVFGENVTRGKPDPEAYLVALERLEVSADESVAFEDSATGAEAAQAAGIRVVRIGSFS